MSIAPMHALELHFNKYIHTSLQLIHLLFLQLNQMKNVIYGKVYVEAVYFLHNELNGLITSSGLCIFYLIRTGFDSLS